MELEEIKKLTEQGEEEYLEDLEKGIRPGFGSPGGKRFLAKTIVSYIPEHKTYIEPFIGGGAVFFAKELSKVEVINDLDKEITFAYRFMKNITDEQFKALKSKNWKASKILFEKLKNLKTDDPLEKFRKIVYLKKLSYGESGKNYDQTNEGRDLTNGLDSLLKIKERLKNVKIENNDYKKSINYDSKETFYYLDPPYTETNNVGNIDLADLHKFCKNLRGKFILSLNNIKKNVDIFKNFNIKKVKVSQQMFTGGSQMQMRTELLISNFPLKKENIYLAKSDEVLIEDLPSFVWIPEFINIAGSLFYERENDRKPNDIDIIVRAKEEDDKFTITLDKSLRLKIDRILEQRVGKMSGKWLTPEWLGSTFGPNWRYQTGWDLVLVPHQPQEIREMNEPEFAEEFYKEENYEEFCDFGSGHFSKFVMEHPEFDSEEFREYVIVHNKADRDSGELEDIAASEILRLAKEFAQEKD
ncbi:DNA adenine methylase, partial [Candidatus Atribacteria bacterium 1244-E10-H5-B2]